MKIAVCVVVVVVILPLKHEDDLQNCYCCAWKSDMLLVSLPGKALTQDATRTLRFIVHADGAVVTACCCCC